MVALVNAAAQLQLTAPETPAADLVAYYRERLGLSYAPSRYQAAIWYAVEHGEGNIVVEAVAGSGKTTTIVHAARLVRGKGLFVSFSKEIATELGKRLEGTTMASSTVHSHGWAAVRRACPGAQVDRSNSKYRDMIYGARDKIERTGSLMRQQLTTAQLDAIFEDGFPYDACRRLVDLARLALLDTEADDFDTQLIALAQHHDLVDYANVLDEIVVKVVRNCLRIGREETSLVDFTDMIWLPVVNNYIPARYDWVIVDECQDISACARELLMMSTTPGGRMLWVGDRRQAIYGFAGADAQSFQAIVEACNATILPLHVCYRCPTIALDVARQWCPQIEARPGAPVGEIIKLHRDDYAAQAVRGDMVICRRNAPLVSLCFDLLAAGIPAVVRGRDIAANLVTIVRKSCKRSAFEGVGTAIGEWESKEIARATKRISDKDRLGEATELIRDKAQCIRVIWSRSKATTIDGLCKEIENMFSDQAAPVTLSSVHRAKGLEAKRVAILDPARLQSTRAKLPWQIEQEENLAYVAWTRTEYTVFELA